VAAVAQNPREPKPLSRWFWEFLKQELAPYSGRAGTVARMVIAAALITIICMTYRIPFSFQGAFYALLISRESSRATLQSSATILLVTAIGAAYLLVSAWFFVNLSVLHFLWIIGSLFLAFYAISILTNYTAAVIFAAMISVGVTLWDARASAETRVENTLWLCLATLIGVATTAAVELVFGRSRTGDEVLLPIVDRLSAVEKLLNCCAGDRPADPAVDQKIIRLQILGTSMLRRILRRSNRPLRYSATMAGLAVLTGRLVDLAAALTQLGYERSTANQTRFRTLAAAIASIRTDLMNRRIPGPVQRVAKEDSAGEVPLLEEMEDTVALIPQVFADSQSHDYLLSPAELPGSPLLVPGALDNPEHSRFALKGCLAAGGCYVIYNGIAWPGISTSVTTCLLTALSTIGSSRQKQVLRLTGAIVGGFLLGMGSQIFILPYLNSIAGFIVLFVGVTALAAWFMTSSPRLSYFGLQVALAFYFINLEEFRFQTSLAVARDRVVGILLGLLAMWFVFDRLWGAPAAVEMKRTFIANLRLLAQSAREPPSTDLKTAIARSIALRETINTNLDRVRALADGVLFEFGPSRRQDLALRDRIRTWQPLLRTWFLLRIALEKYRLQLPGFELPENFRQFQKDYDDRSAAIFDDLAARIEGSASPLHRIPPESLDLLDQMARDYYAAKAQPIPVAHVQSFVTLVREIDRLTASLAEGIVSDLPPARRI
jgi:multidrug resistance protein MdtO